ncbi:MAG: CDP-glycerol glycerophosphotransferase family protein, partial [Eggerthellaceae bacterium]|nr:CDP-glycerol glycerophosphotransferase family protein [Eggerthellaceae bacterium]
KPVVLIAPSWQEDNILDLCIDDMLKSQLGRGWRVIVRPHPEYTKRYRPRWEALQARWAEVPEDELYFERDFSSNETVFTSDVLITDWSSVFCEFCFSTLKPCIFVDTPMKVQNPDWEKVGIVPTDISLRNQVGKSVAPEDIATIGDVAQTMMDNAQDWVETIKQVRAGMFFNLGHGAEAAGEYLLSTILDKQEQRAEEAEATKGA